MERQLPDYETRTLLGLAARLRQAAAEADRPDVVAKVDEVIVAIGGDMEKDGEGRADAVLRFLNGLGL